MTVPTEAFFSIQNWTGSELFFNAGFRAEATNAVGVRSRDPTTGVETELTQGVHFSVSLSVPDKNVTVTPISFPPAPKSIIMYRNSIAVQETDFQDLQDYSAQVHELLHDRWSLNLCEYSGHLTRTPKVPFGEVILDLPRLIDRQGGGAGTLAAYDSAGNPIAILASSITGGAIEEAPIDGNSYGRRNANWTPISAAFSSVTAPLTITAGALTLKLDSADLAVDGSNQLTFANDASLPGSPTIGTVPANSDNSNKIASTSWVRTYAQALDGDLTAIAGLLGTNTIYYRSGVSTWSPVTMGGNMSFAGGVLNSTGWLADAPSDNVYYARRNAGWVDLAPVFQPLDGDLTAIAALTGTNTIYYRSGADTWTPVTMGANLNFVGGTLSATAGGGIPDAAIDGNTYGRKNATWVNLGAVYQPLDGDLSAIAALTGTNTIYYRSGVDTWAAVAIGTGISFAGGTLSATASGGNVSNSGTPSNGQWAQWTDSTHIQGVATASMPFVQKAGDTMTGNLLMQPVSGNVSITLVPPTNQQAIIAASQRWELRLNDGSTESGSNAGSNFDIRRYSDAGGFLGTPFAINRATGAFTLAGDVSVSKATPILNINKAASAQAAAVFGQTNGSNRWRMHLGDATAEGGGNAGSDFSLARYSDAGSAVDVPLFCRRSDGVLALGPASNGAVFDGTAQINIKYSLRGLTMQSTSGSTNSACVFLNNSGSVIGSIDTTTSTTAYQTTSDVRLKSNIEPYVRGREILDMLLVRSFTWKATGERDVGLIAQELERVYPAAVGAGHGEPGDADFTPYRVDNPKLVPVLIQALQSAHARIDELERRLTHLGG